MNGIINNQKVVFNASETILEVARRYNFIIPTLCTDTKLDHYPSSCRICLVDLNGSLVTACDTVMEENDIVNTYSEKVINARKQQLSLLLYDHDSDCLTCFKNSNCKLQKVALSIGSNPMISMPINRSKGKLVGFSYDMNRCIRCFRCQKVCELDALKIVNNSTFLEICFSNNCISCGKCVNHCPTGALIDNSLQKMAILSNKGIIVTPSIVERIANQFKMDYKKAFKKLITFLKRYTENIWYLEEIYKTFLNSNGPVIFSDYASFLYIKERYPNYTQHLLSITLLSDLIELIKREGLDVVLLDDSISSSYYDSECHVTFTKLNRLLSYHNVDFLNLKEDIKDPIWQNIILKRIASIKEINNFLDSADLTFNPSINNAPIYLTI